MQYSRLAAQQALAGFLKQPLSAAFAFSLVLHSIVLFGVGFVLPDPRKAADSQHPLQVVLVNSKSRERPAHADALAQHNLDGGGNTAEKLRASTSMPILSDDKQFTPEQAAQRVQQLEQETKRLMTQAKSTYSVEQEKNQQQQQESDRKSGEDLVQRSLEIARLEAQIEKNTRMYQEMPRRKFIGARTREYRFAQYIEDWRIKVERIGNLNYPEDARRQKIYGSLQLTVSIRADGSVESVEVSHSSGQRILDAAAQRIVKLASPFAPLPPDIRRDTDILSITRTWTFTQTERLESE
ncbi:MAG: energy transducer TonB [Gallionellaceae bacterium]|nr:energy transducer TonB [Gallionellaceae bacterium]